MKSTSYYCAILDRVVKIKNEMRDSNKKEQHTAICQKEKKVCNGNCEGCLMM